MESTFPWDKLRLSIMLALILIYIVYIIGFDPHLAWGVLSFIGLIYGVVEWKMWEREPSNDNMLYVIISLLILSLAVFGYTVFSLVISNLLQLG
ncbi:hypothetical protein ABID56_002226 [Alkalibacillus flavidus]|uniref:Uncharacterized protein n=1 Tax=Alkalibacillus flavidus TaxID=546021 RepID=A0ABV2KZX7_9BACI